MEALAVLLGSFLSVTLTLALFGVLYPRLVIWSDDRAWLRQRKAERAQRWAEIDARIDELARLRP